MGAPTCPPGPVPLRPAPRPGSPSGVPESRASPAASPLSVQSAHPEPSWVQAGERPRAELGLGLAGARGPRTTPALRPPRRLPASRPWPPSRLWPSLASLPSPSLSPHGHKHGVSGRLEGLGGRERFPEWGQVLGGIVIQNQAPSNPSCSPERGPRNPLSWKVSWTQQ